MFAVRGLVISLAVFVVVYCAVSLAVLLSWRKLRDCGQRFAARGFREYWFAELLFAMRMLPLATAGLVTVAFALPSFLVFEPRSIEESLGAAPVVLALLGAILLILGCSRALRALARAAGTIAVWTRGAQSLGETDTRIAVLRTSQPSPAMTLAGILRPRILVSDAAASLLNPNELHAAVNHERAHARRHDNLRKLLLQLVPFPGMRELESAWLETMEVAADHSSVSTAEEALDLASALIKLAHFAPLSPSADLTVALVQSPASLIDARVQRLISWKEEPPVIRRHSVGIAVGSCALTLTIFVLGYAPLLLHVHEATEWLVR